MKMIWSSWPPTSFCSPHLINTSAPLTPYCSAARKACLRKLEYTPA